ncbi:valine--tRNA ligase [Mucilaginibacter sp. PPCGB 2223]|uniref:valine--tRNA ligase n=1 Tax=Mucilaginibacter sp. PPCGB 2223 TaxID=1886027 RepID=UPI00082473AC|nr:valine--tRNA ligase [Mucilaginibacter sp. PPCGB 2223]OCX52889.1 valine--tRNA ligase [Mucilaginibacter sp. PPCGB 2223]
MNTSKTYQPKQSEDKWYSYWLQHGFFKSVPDEREPYTIVIPPPNVTGVLHMGHMLNNTIQDVLIRRARMKGKNACWVPGTDHASIATEAKVVALLKEQGINKKDLTREEFLRHAWDWKEKYGGIILEQLKKLGASCDWDRTRFTMDADLSEAVIDTFIHLYKKGQIYRGVRMVNWDPQGKTAVSDEEVIRKEVNQKLYYIKYQVSSSEYQVSSKENANQSNDLILDTNYLVVATTRPETIMADAAICINPNDERYTHLHGKKVFIPLINREIPVILDEYVSMDFGTGCLKVTPAHDLNDYELGQKHNLPVIDILNDDGTLSEKAQILVGEDRFAARKKIAVLLEEAGALEKVEDYKSQVGFSERTNAAIEPKLSMQWFCKMDEMAKPALDYVLKGDIKLIPEKFVNTYRHWMENVRDWCISRQLWWGQQIPAWYLPNGQYVVAKTAEEALAEAKKLTTDNSQLTTDNLKQDEDVLDTWFSSWLWPISVFDGFKDPNNDDINYYYPTNDLVTAPEILFFWVARMIMAGHEFRGEVPFKNVYLTGIVRDKLGRKMSKSLGNSPDPLDLIEKYGADGVRVGMLLSSPAGNDLMFDESHCEQGRNFANKIWNAFKLIKGWEPNASLSNTNQVSIHWFESRFNQALAEIEEHFTNFRLSDALMTTYKLVWDDFCAWYLEMIKPAYNPDAEKQAIDQETYSATVKFFENILKILHPFMPFISEELWHDEVFGERSVADCCIVAQLPNIGEMDARLLNGVEVIKQLITELRNLRNARQLSPKEKLPLSIKINSGADYQAYLPVITKLGNIETIDFTGDKITGAAGFMVGTDEFFVQLQNNIDADAERERLNAELKYLEGFLKSVNAKLQNERFMANAKPEVVENELKKKTDADTKIRNILEGLKALD